MEHETLRSILGPDAPWHEQSLINARKKAQLIRCMTEFERSVLEEIEEVGTQSYGLNDSEILANLDTLTNQFWKSRLD